MSDDEDVYMQGSQIPRIMNELGYQDFEAVNPTVQLDNNISGDLPKRAHGYFSFSDAESTCAKQIVQILTSGLMFAADSHLVISLTNPIVPIADDSGRRVPSWLLPTTMTLASMTGLYYYNLRSLIPIPLILLSGIGWRALERRHEQQQLRQIKEMLAIQTKLLWLFKKATTFIQEHEMIIRGNILTNETAWNVDFMSLTYPLKWEMMSALRNSIFTSAHNGNTVLNIATKDLIKALPLSEEWDNPKSYLVSSSYSYRKTDKMLSLEALKGSQSTFFLLQSLFLRRLALGFSRRLRLNLNTREVKVVYEIVEDLNIKITQIYVELQKDLTASFNLGLQPKTMRALPKISKYFGVYSAVHSSALHLQAMLIRARAIEDQLKTNMSSEQEATMEEIDRDLELILDQMDPLGSCLNEAVIRARNVKQSPSNASAVIEERKQEEREEVRAGDPKEYVVEDQVFEATCTDADKSHGDFSMEDMLTDEELAKLELEKKFSRTMVRELKTVLVQKAEECQKREAAALRRQKGIEGDDKELEAPTGNPDDKELEAPTGNPDDKELEAPSTTQSDLQQDSEDECCDSLDGYEGYMVKHAAVAAMASQLTRFAVPRSNVVEDWFCDTGECSKDVVDRDSVPIPF